MLSYLILFQFYSDTLSLTFTSSSILLSFLISFYHETTLFTLKSLQEFLEKPKWFHYISHEPLQSARTVKFLDQH